MSSRHVLVKIYAAFDLHKKGMTNFFKNILYERNNRRFRSSTLIGTSTIFVNRDFSPARGIVDLEQAV